MTPMLPVMPAPTLSKSSAPLPDRALATAAQAADHPRMPSVDIRRWTPRRKAAVVLAVWRCAVTREEACARWQLSRDKFAAWEAGYAKRGRRGLYATRRYAHAAALAVIVAGLAAAAAAAQVTGTLQASPNTGLYFNDPEWSDGGFVFDPRSQTGSLSLDYVTGRVFAAPGGTISGTFTANLIAEGPGTLNARVAILSMPDRTVLWASPLMTACCGSPHDPLIENAVPYSFTIPPFVVPASGQMELAYSSAPSNPGVPSDDPCGCGVGGGWGGEDPGFVLTESGGGTPPPPPALTQQEKQRYQRWSVFAVQMTAVFGGAITLSGPAPLPPLLKGALWASGALSGFAAYDLNQLAKDPLDPDYTDIAMPQGYPIPPAGACLTQVASAFSNMAALADAASTSYNRMQYAISINDAYWTAQQGQAMQSYAAQVDSQLKNFQATARCLPVRLSPSGSPVTASDIAGFQADIASNGLPAEATAALAAEGVTDPTDLIASITSADPALAAIAFNALMGPRPRAQYWQALRQAVPLQ